MSYIILAAGKGSNLHPLTLKYPKTSYRLDPETTVLQRMVRGIRKHDRNSEIIVVIGHLSETIKQELEDCNVVFIKNPFFDVTNSIASLWFARDYLERENATIIHGDVVLADELVAEFVTKPTDFPYILMDSSMEDESSYRVVTRNDKVLVMSKQLSDANGRYACVAKLDAVSARLLKNEIAFMVDSGMSDQYYEDALVQMVMFRDFQLHSKDIRGHAWSEVNGVDDLLTAQNIQLESKNK